MAAHTSVRYLKTREEIHARVTAELKKLGSLERSVEVWADHFTDSYYLKLPVWHSKDSEYQNGIREDSSLLNLAEKADNLRQAMAPYDGNINHAISLLGKHVTLLRQTSEHLKETFELVVSLVNRGWLKPGDKSAPLHRRGSLIKVIVGTKIGDLIRYSQQSIRSIALHNYLLGSTTAGVFSSRRGKPISQITEEVEKALARIPKGQPWPPLAEQAGFRRPKPMSAETKTSLMEELLRRRAAAKGAPPERASVANPAERHGRPEQGEPRR